MAEGQSRTFQPRRTNSSKARPLPNLRFSEEISTGDLSLYFYTSLMKSNSKKKDLIGEENVVL